MGTSVEGFTGSCDIVMAASKPKRSGKGEAPFPASRTCQIFC